MDSITGQQRTFVREICSKILSHPFTQIYVSLYLGDYDDTNDDIKLLQEVFQRKNVKLISRPKKLYVGYDDETVKNTLLICKEWFQPLIENLKIRDEKRRSKWSKSYNALASFRTEKILRNILIDNKDKILPAGFDGFEYLVDFEWDVIEGLSNYGKGDLIFGSNYGIYLVIETKWINENTGSTARTSRRKHKNKVKDQAKKYKESAEKKFRKDAIKVIGASFTNKEYNKLQFVSPQDEGIARMLKFI